MDIGSDDEDLDHTSNYFAALENESSGSGQLMGNDIVRGPAFEALPGRKLEKMKEFKAERSKKGFFLLVHGFSNRGKVVYFLNTIRLQLLFLPQAKLLRIWWPKVIPVLTSLRPWITHRSLVQLSTRLCEFLVSSLIWSRKPSRTQASCCRCVDLKPCYVFASVLWLILFLDVLPSRLIPTVYCPSLVMVATKLPFVLLLPGLEL